MPEPAAYHPIANAIAGVDYSPFAPQFIIAVIVVCFMICGIYFSSMLGQDLGESIVSL